MAHETLPKQKKIEKIMQCTIIISLPLFYGSGFKKKRRNYYNFKIALKVQKNTLKKNQ